MPLLGVPGGTAQLPLVLRRTRAQSVSDVPGLIVVMGEPNTFMKRSNLVLITLHNQVQKK